MSGVIKANAQSILERVTGWIVRYGKDPVPLHCIERMIEIDESCGGTLLRRTERGEIDNDHLYKEAQKLERTHYSLEDHKLLQKEKEEYERRMRAESSSLRNVSAMH